MAKKKSIRARRVAPEPPPNRELAWAIVRRIEAQIGSGLSPLDWNVREARQAMLEKWVKGVEEELE